MPPQRGEIPTRPGSGAPESPRTRHDRSAPHLAATAKAAGAKLAATNRAENERALTTSGRLLSVYKARSGVMGYVITEAGGETTTTVAPGDY